jgi:peptidase C39-like protein
LNIKKLLPDGKRLTGWRFFQVMKAIKPEALTDYCLNRGTHLLMLVVAIAATSPQAAGANTQTNGRQFIGFDSFSGFTETEGGTSGEAVLTSPVILARINFNEAIASWNAELGQNSYLVVEARAVYPQASTKYYKLGLWSKDPARRPRQSVAHQSDADGDVSTDTLILRRPARRLQIRLTVGGESSAKASLRFLGVSLTDTNAPPPELAPDKQAWGKLISVPERTQMVYPNGKTLCSPTTVSMLMGYWAQTLKRPELDCSVPQIVDAIYDSQWQGTGNWPFNMAYAGSFPGMRAYVSRLGDISELEAWIAQNLPVGLSVDYDRLRAKGPGPNGHLVVLVGFTKEGDPIINDPGTSEHVRKVFRRKNLIDAWACSRNTVYMVYPINSPLPEDRFGHWDSARSK